MAAKSCIPIRITRQTHARLSVLRDQIFADYHAVNPGSRSRTISANTCRSITS